MEKGEMLRVTTKQKATLSFSKHYQDMAKILGNQEFINPRHVLESSPLIEAQSSPQIDQDIQDKEILDEEVCAAVSAQKRKLVQSDDLPGPSGEVGTSDSDEDESLAFAKSLFFKNKGKQGKCTSTPKSTPKNTPKNRKDGKKAARKKTKATAIVNEPTQGLYTFDLLKFHDFLCFSP